MIQSNEPEEPKKHSKKDRKGKKDKKKRGKKGRGKKESRKKRKEGEAGPEEEGFVQVSTVLPVNQSQETYYPTEKPSTMELFTPEAVTPSEAPDQTTMIPERPTHRPDSDIEDPSVVPSALPESKVTEEVDWKVTMQLPLPIHPIPNRALTHSPRMPHLHPLSTCSSPHYDL